MSDDEITPLRLRMDTLEQLLKELDAKNADRFREMRQAIVGDSIDAKKPGILRRLQSLETRNQSLETRKNRMTRNAQAVWGVLGAIIAVFVSWLLGLFGEKP